MKTPQDLSKEVELLKQIEEANNTLASECSLERARILQEQGMIAQLASQSKVFEKAAYVPNVVCLNPASGLWYIGDSNLRKLVDGGSLETTESLREALDAWEAYRGEVLDYLRSTLRDKQLNSPK